MNKKELVEEVTKVVCSRKEAESAVECVLESIKKAMKKGDKVTLTGFGSFSVTKRAARREEIPERVRKSRSRPARSPNSRRPKNSRSW